VRPQSLGRDRQGHGTRGSQLGRARSWTARGPYLTVVLARHKGRDGRLGPALGGARPRDR
jgi:hypothetical protein